ncbi:MAG: outer membrane protein assembly factor BamA [Salinarimonas sp.]|nr:outer membrane protein assembly factor BamA [Salinarimonas sp.]
MSSKNARRSVTAKRTTVALAMAMAAFGVSEAFAQQVIVEGNQRVDTDTIRSYVVGSSPDEARRNLVATGLFSDVRVSRQGGSVVVRVAENQVINRVAFEGNRRLRSEALLPEMQTRANRPYNPATVDEDVRRIRELYRRSGRALAEVTPRTVELENGRIDVVFTVDEGARTNIRAINFVGNDAISSRRLRDAMSSEVSSIFTLLRTTDVYDPDRLAADLEAVRRYYMRRGYADAQVIGSDVTFDADRRGYVITITVEEGPRYRVGNVTVDSRIPDVAEEELRRRVATRAGGIYDSTEVERTLVDMTTSVSQRGYAFAQVRPVGVRNEAEGTIDLTYVVEEGPRVYIERINIRGNTRTRDYVIRRELDLGEGDPYNRVLLDRAERRLRNLGFFENVRITQEPSMSPDRVVLNIEVEDKPTGSFSVGGGYSTADGFLGEVSLSEDNFLGRGQAVRISGGFGQRSQSYDFSFTEPYFLGYRLSAGFDLFSRYNEERTFARYESRTEGGTVRFGIPITEEFSISPRYTLLQQRITIPDGFRRNASPALLESEGRRTTSLVGLSFTYNSLDNVQDPTSGFLVEVAPEVAGLGGDANFFRITGDARYYHELTEGVVGIARAQAGHISGFGNRRLRMNDHFFKGPNLVRGFESGGIGPRDADPSRNTALGGTTYFGGSLEVQFEIPLLPRAIGIKGAVFADAGTLFNYDGMRSFDGRDFDVRDSRSIRSSVGAGLIWRSPLGPIRFDYAIATSKASGDRVQAFRFSGGTSF